MAEESAYEGWLGLLRRAISLLRSAQAHDGLGHPVKAKRDREIAANRLQDTVDDIRKH